MIEFSQLDGRILARQRLVSPSVYLDHWALRKISASRKLSARFAAALRSSGGTLALSVISQGEFSGLRYSAEAEAADRLLDAIVPNVFFIRIEPFEVINNEEQLVAGPSEVHPAADDELLRDYVELAPGPLIGKGMFTLMVRNSGQLATSMQELGSQTLLAIERLRAQYDAEPDLKRRAHRAPMNARGFRPTHALMQILIRRFLTDRREQLEGNDSIDLLHTVVPVSYCDFVLLDRRWTAAVKEAGRALRRPGDISERIATVFSERNNGMEKFLVCLESLARPSAADDR